MITCSVPITVLSSEGSTSFNPYQKPCLLAASITLVTVFADEVKKLVQVTQSLTVKARFETPSVNFQSLQGQMTHLDRLHDDASHQSSAETGTCYGLCTPGGREELVMRFHALREQVHELREHL